MRLKRFIPIAAAAAAVAGLTAAALFAPAPAHTVPAEPQHVPHMAAGACTAVPSSSDLPVLTSSAVVASLEAAPARIKPWARSFQLAGTTATVFEKTGRGLTAVATLDRTTPWETVPQPVVVISTDDCGMSQILTAARQRLPAAGAPAPAQTAGWVRTSDLAPGHETAKQLRVDVARETVAIVDGGGKVERTWPIVTGATDTPTPAGVGYLESVYLDPSQTETEGSAISLTSLHSPTMATFGGNNGELGIHAFRDSLGNSHGCIRLPSTDAANTIGKLPTGTPVVIVT